MKDKNLTVEQFIEAVKNHPVTEETIKAFEQRMRETEAEFKEEMDSMKITQEWLNRSYNI